LHDSWFSPPSCHPNTRKTVLKEIQEWLDKPKSSPVLWLNGPAGVGKSVIAKTISGLQNNVVGTFFFSTSSDRSAATLFPTLAWQLARRIPETRPYILDALKSSDALQTSQIEQQFDLFIVQPLKNVSCSGKLMIIDGVDECVDENMLKRFLRVLTEAAETHSMPLRFLICSRPEPRIHAILERAPDDPPDTPIGLSDESKEDIARYLEDKFNTIRQPAKNGSPWFQQSDIRELVQRSCGQFLYASTIVRLLD
ncbi:hypothetical protein M378DRAFT_46701, partial [Amanita muscaria Koide BX008]